MRREMDWEAVSDGKLYSSRDLVKAGCGDCLGCWQCCTGMGNSVILDPWDLFQMERGTGQSFEELLTSALELHVVDGVVLPNLRMAGPEERCGFLSAEGRCRIHPYRPGFCRMFPLGRIYQKESFRYFLQVQECPRQPKTKVRISKWLDIPDLKAYENFVLAWHRLLKEAEGLLGQISDPETTKRLSLFILQTFYLAPYDTAADFYEQFVRRQQEWGRFTESVL